MEPLTIILGVSLIFVAAYAADRNEAAKKFRDLHFEQFETEEDLRDISRILKADNSRLAKILSKTKSNWPEMQALRQDNEDLRELIRCSAPANSAKVPGPLNQGQKAPEVLKIELGEDFAALKTSIDSLGSVAILKTELDRAHKREAIYMKRLLVSNAAILAASKKGVAMETLEQKFLGALVLPLNQTPVQKAESCSYIADKHAEGFAKFLVRDCKPHWPGFIFEGSLYTIRGLLVLYKKRHPNGH